MAGNPRQLVSEVHTLARACFDGTDEAPFSFYELVVKLLGLTIAATDRPLVIHRGATGHSWVIEGANDGTLALRNGWYLKLGQEVELHDTRDGLRLKTRTSVYQYQRDADPE